MNNRLIATLVKSQIETRKLFVPYLTAGFPDMKATERLVRALEAAGADAIELGVPFSDPLADGPVIQRASEAALRKGVTLPDILGMVRRLRRTVRVPLILMTYMNPVMQYGLDRFCRDSVRAGVDGVIVPDLPVEESTSLRSAAQRAGLCPVFLLAPTSTDASIRAAGKASRGFLYCVSVMGTTGARKGLSRGLAGLVNRIRRLTGRPVLVGFGISTPAHARAVCRFADGVIVGSAVISVIEKALVRRQHPVPAVGRFAAVMARAVSTGRSPARSERSERRCTSDAHY